MKSRSLFKALFVFTSIVLLTACGGGGGGGGGGADGSGVSLALPSGVDVLKVEGQSAQTIGTAQVGTLAYNSAGTDYSNAGGDFHVSHPVGEALSTTSEIMCFLGQLGLGDLWQDSFSSTNTLTYLVGVDDSECSSESGQPSQGAASGGGGGSSAATQLSMVTVTLSRNDSNFPRVQLWFDETDGPGGNPMQIRASVDVFEKPETTTPYGKFDLAFAMVDSNSTTIGQGNLLTTHSGSGAAFTFFETFSDGGQSAVKGASVEMAADGSNLKAAVEADSPWDPNSAWVVATNDTSVKANNKNSSSGTANSVGEVDLNGGQCLSTENFKYRVHGYGLFNDADGSKVSLSTGVSCEYTDSSSQVRHCHIGRHGAWFDRESNGTEHTFSNGDTVTQRAWGSDAANDGRALTLFVSDGKLMKFTVKQYTLAELKGTDMRWYDNGGGQEYIVNYLNNGDSDGNGGNVGADGFYKVATMSWSQNGPPSKTDITADAITITADQWYWFWSDTLGGISLIGDSNGNAAVDDADVATARQEELITPSYSGFSGGELALKCLNKCPETAISQSNLQTWNGPYQTDPANIGAALDYVMKQSDMTLHKGTDAAQNTVGLDTGVTFDGTGSVHNWGIESGALVNATGAAASDYPQLNDLWNIYDTPGNSYYQYRMGPNNWDKLVLVKAGATFLTFDEPISFDYTHLTANDRNNDSTYNGQKFLLRYHGEGHMEGFPWDQVDRDGDGNPDMWFPVVSLNDGIQLTDGSSNDYRLKALHGDLTLDTTGSDCSGITLALPTAAVPSAISSSPSNHAVAKPDHTCQYDAESGTCN